jgi:hypothetical protein
LAQGPDVNLRTASQVLGYAKQLEDDAVRLYQSMSESYPSSGEAFLSLAKQNKKNMLLIDRAYWGINNDAFETGFCFEIDIDDGAPRLEHSGCAGYSQCIEDAIGQERKAGAFYSIAAEQSKSLLADLTRILLQIAGTKADREKTLISLIGTGGA